MIIALLSLAFIQLCALITPGPDFILVSQTAISRSRREAVLVVLGITVAVMTWAMLALLGLNIIFQKMAWLRQILFVVGGIYLCWLGAQMLRSAFSKQKGETPVVRQELPQKGSKFFLKGFITNISNPKAVIYFGSVFSLFLANPALDHLHWLMFIIIALETLLWFLFVVFIFSLPRFKAAYQNAAKWIDGISGGIFTAFGLFLISQR